jgi:hypothetical protein
MPGLAGPEYMDVWEHREISAILAVGSLKRWKASSSFRIARSIFGRKVEDEDVFFHPDKE